MSQISLTVRRVAKVSSPDTKPTYRVFELLEDGTWLEASKDYEHSTSAFAALGRLTQKDVLAQYPDDPEVN